MRYGGYGGRRQVQRRQIDPAAAQQIAEVLADLPPIHVAVYKGATGFAKKFPITTTLYCIGMVLMIFASGMTVSEEAHEEYGQLLEQAQAETNALEKAEIAVARASQEYNSKRGFLGFSCDAACTAAYERLQHHERIHKQAKDEHYKALSHAKSKVGVLSMYAVQESRDLFWGLMAKGKGFAKRTSTWDLLFMGLGSMGSDEGWISFIIRFAFQVLMNFTLGLIGALVGFIWYLWELVRSYQPDTFTAVLAFLLFTITACSMVATYLLALYGTVGATLYMGARTLASNMRIEGGGGGRGPAGHIGGTEQGRGGQAEGEPRQQRQQGGGGGPPRIRIVGLQSRPELNGCLGVVTGQEPGTDGLPRFKVRLDDGRELKVKEANLDMHVD